MDYRLYRPGDLPALYAIEELCFQPPFRFSRRTMRQLVESPESATWIAEDAGQMAGFAIVHWSGKSDETIAYVQTLEVTPSQRKRKIGRELLSRVESSAAAAGALAIWLHVAQSNSAAIRLYESHGYLAQGRQENYYAKGIPALVYAKRLESGNPQNRDSIK